jgi:cation:H+ antiporter
VLLILPSALILIFALDFNISSMEGLLLIAPLPIFLYLMIKQGAGTEAVENTGSINLVLSFLWIFLGGGALYFGSSLAISGSLELVALHGLSKGFAGAIILAAGTGLPELVTTIVAGVKRETSLAFANIVGSNALNAFGVLGLSALLFPFDVPSTIAFSNAPILLAVSVVGLTPLMIISNQYFLKFWSLVLFCFYAAFMWTSF